MLMASMIAIKNQQYNSMPVTMNSTIVWVNSKYDILKFTKKNKLVCLKNILLIFNLVRIKANSIGCP